MDDDELMPRQQRPEHAQIEQQAAGGMQREFKLFPDIAGKQADAAQRDILQRQIARALGAIISMRPLSAR